MHWNVPKFSRLWPHVTQERCLVLAQLLTLAALACALRFLFHTNARTVFMFTVVGGTLASVAMAIVIAAAIHAFLKRHSLFIYETREPGEIIVREGDPGDCVYFIQSGQVEVVDGQESVIAELREGEYFGEMALVSNAPRVATVRAATNTRLAVLGKDNFATMCRLLPATKEGFLQTIQQRAMRARRRGH